MGTRPRPVDLWPHFAAGGPVPMGQVLKFTKTFLLHRCARNNRRPGPDELRGRGAAFVAKPYNFIWFGDIDGPKVYESSSHVLILDFSLDGGPEAVTKWYSNWCPGLILGAFCTFFRAGPVWRGHGAQLCRKKTENQPKQQFRY